MRNLIILDAGHGIDTPGKRTPVFEDGSFMHERSFNQAVVKEMIKQLQKYDCLVKWVSKEEKDIPLSVRTSRANMYLQDFTKLYGKTNVNSVFISVHANAATEHWGMANGIETYYLSTGHSSGLKLAQAVQKQLIAYTKLRDRGIKTANFFVLRETYMPAILCECGFMDYKPEARLLRSDAYRIQCATAIVKGIVNYMNLELIPPAVTHPSSTIQPSPNAIVNKLQIELDGQLKTVNSIYKDGFN